MAMNKISTVEFTYLIQMQGYMASITEMNYHLKDLHKACEVKLD